MLRASLAGQPSEPGQPTKHRWLGIDFSGDLTQWRPARKRGNVWIADVREMGGRRTLCALFRVQALADATDRSAFARLVELLARGDYEAAAIDAPFSIPQESAARGSHADLLKKVGAIVSDGNRPFPSGVSFVEAVTRQKPPLVPPQPYRVTEQFWLGKGVNVRSTLWAGPPEVCRRPGAPMAAACITLLHLSRRPIWPWVEPPAKGLLVEAFPAAQLRHWDMLYKQYSGRKPSALAPRQRILTGIRPRLEIPDPFVAQMADSADALDAVLCAFAAVAVTENKVAYQPEPVAAQEGWIAVHL